MLTAAVTANTHGTGEVSGQHGNTLRRLFNALSTWRQRRRGSAELQAQGDFVLKDIGLARSKIELDPERLSQWLRLEWR